MISKQMVVFDNCLIFIGNMTPRDDSIWSINIQLYDKKYASSSYVMNNFLQEENMLGILSGTKGKPTYENVANYTILLDSWETNNLKIIIWINNSIIQSIGIHLANYDTKNEV